MTTEKQMKKIVGLIPARGGSRGIPLKNIKPLNNKPLIYWIAKAASDCELLDHIYVSTDSQQIFDTVVDLNINKVTPIWRSAESATDNAPSILPIMEFAEKYDFDILCLLQATQPLVQTHEIEKGIQMMFDDGVDSVISCVKETVWEWRIDNSGFAHPVGHIPKNRIRRQDADDQYFENGAFYITTKDNLIENGCHMSGNIKLCENDKITKIEIDDLRDWEIAEILLKNTLQKN